MDPGAVEAALAEAKKLTDQSENGKVTTPEKEKEEPSIKIVDENVESVEFKVVYNKKKYDVKFPLDSDIAALKSYLQTIIDIHPTLMKVMIKGLAKDEMTLRKLGVTKSSKVMVIGSSLSDVISATTTPTDKEIRQQETSNKTQTASSKDKIFKKILEQGKPDDIMPGIRNKKSPLPPTPLTGMLNKYGGKVRLTFKMELDQIWIGTKERTEKVRMSSIKNVISEPIQDHEDYCILALQLGPTEASRYWIYWVPAQYVDAIKDTILGKWGL